LDKFFEFELEVSDPAIAEALIEMIDIVGTLAAKHGVCPTCLTFAFADGISKLVEEGRIGHVDGTSTHVGETVQ
jgi:hypothetical protein